MAQSDMFGMSPFPRKRGRGLRAWLEGTLGLAAGLILVSLVMITVVDVIGRYVFSAPLKGAFELTELLVAALVFAALPLTTERREHVEVDLLQPLSRGPLGRATDLMVGVFSALLLLTFAWRLWVYALQLQADGTATNALGLPLAPFGFFAAFSCLISAAIAAYLGLYPPQAQIKSETKS